MRNLFNFLQLKRILFFPTGKIGSGVYSYHYLSNQIQKNSLTIRSRLTYTKRPQSLSYLSVDGMQMRIINSQRVSRSRQHYFLCQTNDSLRLAKQLIEAEIPNGFCILQYWNILLRHLMSNVSLLSSFTKSKERYCYYTVYNEKTSITY